MYHLGKRAKLPLLSILLGIYLLSYRGIPLSGDELAMFSSTESLVRHGESRIYSVYYQYPGHGDIPFSEPVHEPMQILLAIPLYWTAFQTHWIGMLHTVWLFNIFVTAGIGVLIYKIGITLDYSKNMSLATALIVSLGTMLWPYTQTFFREPLAAFWVTLAFYLAFLLQKHWRWWMAGVLLLVCVAALLTKEIMFLMFPALVVILWPPKTDRRKLLTSSSLLVGGLVIILAIVVVISETNFGNNRFEVANYTSRMEESSFDYFLTVLGAYLISPGHSIWATSPILILSLYGSWLAYQNKQGRLALAPLILLGTTTIGYAVGGWDWHGGLGWGTRYLLHVIPAMGLLLLPVLQKVLSSNRLWWLMGAVLLVFSVAVQMGGVLVPMNFAYDTLLAEFPEKGAAAYQEEGTWQVKYAQWYLNLTHIDWDNLAVAWKESGIGLLVGSSFILLGIGFFWWEHHFNRQLSLRQLWLFLPVWVVGFGFALHAIREDSRFYADRPELQALVESIHESAESDDMVLLANPEYLYFFLNSYRGEAALVTLPYLQSERYSPNQPEPFIEDIDNDGFIVPSERLDETTHRLLKYLPDYNNVWLVMNSGPFFPWAYRPVEHLLSINAFPVHESKWSEDVRLLRFYPYLFYPYAPYLTKHPRYQFGENIFLTAYDVPSTITPGSTVPVALVWESSASLPQDYIVSVAVINQDGLLVAQHDSPPQGGFANTSTWAAGKSYMDTHGIALPKNLPSGTYTILVVIYDWRDGSRLPVLHQNTGVNTDTAEIGRLVVNVSQEADTPVLNPSLPMETTAHQFGSSFELTSYYFNNCAVAGSNFEITTSWESHLEGKFNPTLILEKAGGSEVSAVNGSSISLFNEQFRSGLHLYRHEIFIPDSFAAGTYYVQAMIFDWKTLPPTPIAPETGSGYQVTLGSIDVISPTDSSSDCD